MLKHVSYRQSANFTKNEFSHYRRSSLSSPDSDYKAGEIRRKNSQLSLYSPYVDNMSLRNFTNEDSLSLRSGFECLSRFSSTLSLNDPNVVPVKVYLRSLRKDMEYKTLPMSTATTCRQMVMSLLVKFRLKHRDPNLFFVMMEMNVRTTDRDPIKRLLVLDDNARPAELQQCRPKGEARFTIGTRNGGVIRIHDSVLMPGSQYKSLNVAHHTTSRELIQLLLWCYNKQDPPYMYSIHEICKSPSRDRELGEHDFPLEIQSRWKSSSYFVIRKNASYIKPKHLWRRSYDQSSTDESEIDEHNTTRASIISSSSSSSGISSLSSTSSTGSNSSGEDSCLSVPITIKCKEPTVKQAHNTNPMQLSPIKPVNINNRFSLPWHSTPKPPPRNIHIIIKEKLVNIKEPPVNIKEPPLNIKEPPAMPEQTETNTEPSKTETISSTDINKCRQELESVDTSENKVCPKASPRKFSLPGFCKDVRYSRLTSPERRILPDTPSPVKKPPRPVPRTLFLPTRSRSLGRDEKVDDSGVESTDQDTMASCDKSDTNVSFGVLSHTNPKKACIRSLSKSFANLSVLSSDKDSEPDPKVQSAQTLSEAQCTNTTDDGIGKSKHAEIEHCKSYHNLTESVCKRNCESCFYI